MRLAAITSIIACVAAVSAIQLAPPAFAQSFSGAYLAAEHARNDADVFAASKYYQRALSYQPSDVELLSYATQYALVAGEDARAVELAARLQETAPERRVAHYILVSEALSAGRHQDALELIEAFDVSKADAAFAAALLRSRTLRRYDGAQTLGAHRALNEILRAWSLHGAGQDLEALQVLEAQGAFGKFHAALITDLSGAHDRAAELMDEAVALAKGATLRMTLAHGVILRRAERFEEAAELYRTALQRDPNIGAVRAALNALEAKQEVEPFVNNAAEGAAEAFLGVSSAFSGHRVESLALALRLTDLSTAAHARLALKLRPDLTNAQLIMAGVFEDLSLWRAVAEMSQQVAPGSPYFEAAQIGRANALRRLGELTQAAAAMRELTAHESATEMSHFVLGDILSTQRDYSACRQAYGDGLEQAKELQSWHWRILYQRGICADQSGSWEDAEADFRQALSLSPEQPDVMNYLGYSLVEKGERLDEALELIKKAVKRAPERGYIIDSLGWAQYRLGDFESAVQTLQDAVVREPTEPVINDHLGDALWVVGRKMEARFQWSRALSFEPADKDRARIERKLEVGLDVVLEEEAEMAPAKKADASEDAAPRSEVSSGARGG